MGQGPSFPGQQSGMYSQAYPQGVHPAAAAAAGAGYGQSVPQTGAWGSWMGPRPQAQQLPQGWSGDANLGGQYGGAVTSQDPWSWLGQDQSGTAAGQFHRMMGGAGQAGVFDPMGSTPLVNMLQGIYQGQSAGQQRGALEQARNNMVDPSSYGYASLMSQLGGQGHMADALANARYQSAQQNQDWLRNNVGGSFLNQLGGYLGKNMDLAMQEKLQSEQQHMKANQGLGGMLGGLAGSALGALIPGGGAIGSAMGGLFGGGNTGNSNGTPGQFIGPPAPQNSFGGGQSQFGGGQPDLQSLLAMLQGGGY
jgi:hypothetical protein